MEIGGWIAHNWFDLLGTIGTVGGLFFAGFAVFEDSKARRVSNLIALTQNHREIWQGFHLQPELSRVLDPTAEIDSAPLTLAEETFVKLVILHLSSVYRATKTDLMIQPERMPLDVGMLFALPVPKAVWEKLKAFQDEDFKTFVESCLE